MKLLNTLLNTVKTHNLLDNGDRVLVALSGGADSVALLRLLLEISEEYDISVAAAHINHQLRDTADRDMNFCKDLCADLGVHLDILTCDIKKGAKEKGVSEELYARNVRYDFLESLGYDKIATAHNKNDNAETLLYNFMRGASLSGLCGIPYKRGNIIRPLLDIEKSEIVRFCNENGYGFMTDETNLSEIYTRNKIRLSLIPKIEQEFNENFVNTVTANSELLSFDNDFLEAEAEKLYNGEILSDFSGSIPPALLFRLIQRYFKERTGSFQNLPLGFVKSIVSLLKGNKTGSKTDLPDGFEAYISYGRLFIDKKGEIPQFEYEIKPDIPVFIPEIQKTAVLKENKNGKIFLSDTEELKIRNKRDGDIFYPVGMTGKKRLSDYFSARGIFALAILTKYNEIVSVLGYRDHRRFTDKSHTPYSVFIKEADNAE